MADSQTMRRISFPLVLGMASAAVLSVQATAYSWLADPVSGLWLADTNWDNGGVWVENAANTANFPESTQKLVDVNGAVTLAGMTVRADGYVFTNGVIDVEGGFGVANGMQATVCSELTQTQSATRWQKVGSGGLTVKGDGSVTNRFHRLAVRGGTLTLDGGVTEVTGPSSGAGESQVAGSFANSSRLHLTGGAQLVFRTPSSYLSNSGCEMLIDDGCFNCWNFSEFLNGFSDNNGSDQAKVGSLTVRDRGVVHARQLRISKVDRGAAFWTKDYGVVNVLTGGVMRVRNFTMDVGSSRKTATLNIDGGTVEFVNTDSEATNRNHRTVRFCSNSAEEFTCWTNVTLNVGSGGATIVNKNNASYCYKGFTGPGDVLFKGGNTLYWWGTSTYTGRTVVDGNVWFAIQKDANLGSVPAEPTNNLCYRSSSAILHFDRTTDLHKNRTIWMETNVTLQVGTQNGQNGRIHGVFAGPDNGKSNRLVIMPNWKGVTTLQTEDDRTNYIGRLLVSGKFNLASGTIVITSNTLAKIHSENGFLVSRESTPQTASVNPDYANLTVTGGRIYFPPAASGKASDNMYVELAGGGQVIVKGGVIDASRTREWLNGLGTPAWTVVQDAGELIASQIRIAQASHLDANGDPLCQIQVKTGGVLRLDKFWVDTTATSTYQRGLVLLDGGTLVARCDCVTFLGSTKPHWTNILVRVCAGGARIDTDGHAISVFSPLLSGCASDGGLTKLGAGILTLQGASTYNGPTCVTGGTLVFEKAENFPGGHLDFTAAAIAAKTDAAPYITAPALTLREDSCVRVRGAQTLNEKTFGTKKALATVATPFEKTPELVFLNDAGEEISSGGWALTLASDRRTLFFGAARGTMLFLR